MNFDFDLRTIVSIVSSIGLLVVGLSKLLKHIRRLISEGRETGEAVASITPESTQESITQESPQQSARFFSALVTTTGIAFAALLLLSIDSQALSPQFRTLCLFAGALTVLGLLLEIFAVPAYMAVMNLKKEQVESKQMMNTILVQNRLLAEQVEALRAQIQTPPLKPQLPVSRKRTSVAHGSANQAEKSKSVTQKNHSAKSPSLNN